MGGTDLLKDFFVQCLSWCRKAVVRVFHPLSARILRVSRAHLLHQSETDRESTSVKAARAPISGAELARLLGNHVEDEESDFEQTSTSWEETHSSPSNLPATEKDFGSPFFKLPSTNVEKVVSTDPLTDVCSVDVVPQRYEKSSAVPGQVLLDAIETGDDDVLDLIRNCSVEALNFRDGLHKNALLIASTEGRLEVLAKVDAHARDVHMCTFRVFQVLLCPTQMRTRRFVYSGISHIWSVCASNSQSISGVFRTKGNLFRFRFVCFCLLFCSCLLSFGFLCLVFLRFFLSVCDLLGFFFSPCSNVR